MTPQHRALTQAQEKEAIPILLKASIKHGRLLRTHQALLLTTFTGDASQPWVAAVKQAGTLYHQSTSGKSGHLLGSPAQYLWQAFVEVVVTQAAGEDPTKLLQLKAPPLPAMQPLWEIYTTKLLITDLEAGEGEQLDKKTLENKLFFEPLVKHFKIEDLRDNQSRLQFNLASPELATATEAALGWTTFTKRLGPDRPDFLEKEAGRLLGGKGRR